MISIAAKQRRSDSIRQAAAIARLKNAKVRDCPSYLIVSADTKNFILISEGPFNAPPPVMLKLIDAQLEIAKKFYIS